MEFTSSGPNAYYPYTPLAYPHPLVSGEEPPPQDTTPPSDIASVNDGTGGDIDSTVSTTQLSANWTAATDGESSISKYWYAIGTTAGGTQTLAWTSTSNGTVTSVIKTGLTLTVGTKYYFTVKAENGVSLQSNSTSSDGQLVVTGGGGTLPEEDELDVKVYPNPYILSGSNSMTFSINGTTGGEVRIYTVSGKLVRKLDIGAGESAVNWNAANESGNPIKSGMYVYIISDGNEKKKTGKVIISN
jgi:hypothetical protein